MPSDRPDTDSLLFFGEDWGRHNSTGQYLALALKRSYRVIWWDSLGLRRPSLTPADIGRAAAKLLRFAGRLVARRREDPEDDMEVVTPLVIPYHGPRWVGRVNAALVRALAAREGAYPPAIVIAACPAAADVMERIPARLKVYYCADEYSSLPGMDENKVRSLERRLLAAVDVVVASSRTLVEEKGKQHKNVRYLPHGVDYESFSRAVMTPRSPPELERVSRPIVGFVGLVDEHIDLDLIAFLARSFPEVEFVFVGPVEVDNPPRRSNIHYLGPRPHRRLFGYLAQFDVGIIPYRRGPFAENANPTKLREYLAAGLPVVSVPVPEAKAISPHVQFAENPPEFAHTLGELLSKPRKSSRKTISLSVKEQSWSARGEALETIIRHELGDGDSMLPPVRADAG